MNITAIVNRTISIDTFKIIKAITNETKEIAFLSKNNSQNLDSLIPKLSEWGVDFGTQGIIKHAPINLCINLPSIFEGNNDQDAYIIPIHPIMVISGKAQAEHDINVVNDTVLDIAEFDSIYSPMADDVKDFNQDILSALRNSSLNNPYMHSIIEDYENWALLGYSDKQDILAIYYAMACVALTKRTIQ